MIEDFKRAGSIEEAVSLSKQGYVFLAGGTQVNNAAYRASQRATGRRPDPHTAEARRGGDVRPAPVTRVVSLDGLDLGGISRDGDECVVGAGVTLQELADSPDVPEALRTAAGFIPTRSVRNVATVGGNVGAKRADSYVIPALIALGARAETAEGTSSVEEYVFGEDQVLILRFRIPAVDGVCRAVKESRSHLALPVVSAAVRIAAARGGTGGAGGDAGGGPEPDAAPGAVRSATVVAGCVAERTVRLGSVEEGLRSGELLAPERGGRGPAGASDAGARSNGAAGPGAPGSGASGWGALEEAIAAAIEPASDFLGSAEFKRYENAVVIADCIRSCIREAGL